MSTPFLAELKYLAFNFAPKGWAQANGNLLAINQNQALFSLLGTTYGGNGVTTFALPDLRGRMPMHFGNGFVQGQVGGQENHTLTSSEMPQHGHGLNAQNVAAVAAVAPGGNSFANAATNPYRTGFAQAVTMAGASSNTGGNQPHNNIQPYLVVVAVIALQGIFPSRN